MQKSKEGKLEKLKDIIKGMRKVVVAYSGGVDSTFLLFLAKTVLGSENVIAATALSASYPASEKCLAEEIAKRLSVNHIFIETDELGNKNFRENPVNRCYYCKKELFRKLKKTAEERRFSFILDGSTLDDLADIRYGRLAAEEEGIRSPIQEAEISKDEVRIFSRRMNIDTWDKPSFACLASRFSYNQEITEEKLKAVEEAEDFIKGFGFRQLRVRCHEGNLIRIEVNKQEVEKITSVGVRERVVKKLKTLGFVYITLDLVGYRTGSMNEGIRLTPKNGRIFRPNSHNSAG